MPKPKARTDDKPLLQFITIDRFLVAYLLSRGCRWMTTRFDGRMVNFVYPSNAECEALQVDYIQDTDLLRYRTALEEVWNTIRQHKVEE